MDQEHASQELAEQQLVEVEPAVDSPSGEVPQGPQHVLGVQQVGARKKKRVRGVLVPSKERKKHMQNFFTKQWKQVK